jgi:hypothetical protein
MKIGEAHRTQSSSLYSANTIGAPMHSAPIGVADRTRQKNYWRTVPGERCLLARGTSERQYIWAHRGPSAPLYWRSDVPYAITKCYNSAGGSLKCYKKRRTEHFGAPHLFSF